MDKYDRLLPEREASWMRSFRKPSGPIPELIASGERRSTGMVDKNGVEIFEGDLVSYYVMESFSIASFVAVEDDAFVLRFNDGKAGKMAYTHSRQLKVYGNIRDNPDEIKDWQ